MKIDKKALLREVYKRSFYDFVVAAWPTVEPLQQYSDNWHIKEICKHLEACYNGDINRLVINIPPGHCKTLLTSVFFNAWAWIKQPSLKFGYLGYNASIMVNSHEKFQRLVESDWYQGLFGDAFQPDKDSWNKKKLVNTMSGERHSDSLYGGITGKHFDFIFVDDPLKAKDAVGSASQLKTQMTSCADAFNTQVSNRLTREATSRIILIMQRLHEDDLAGVLLKTGDYEHLCLPAYYRENQYTFNKLGRYDPREKEGEVLWKDLFPGDALERRRKALASALQFSAQYQQSPIPAEGNLFKHEWLKFYENLPAKGNMIVSVDTAFGLSDKSDFTVVQCWLRAGADYYLVDQIRERFDFPQAVEAIARFNKKWPKALPIYVELTSNGPAIVEMLKKMGVSGIKGEKTPHTSKYSRANAVSPLFEAGNVYLPDPNKVSWVMAFIEELTAFDNGRHDDQVDAMSMALNKLHKRDVAGMAANLANFIRRR